MLYNLRFQKFKTLNYLKNGLSLVSLSWRKDSSGMNSSIQRKKNIKGGKLNKVTDTEIVDLIIYS